MTRFDAALLPIWRDPPAGGAENMALDEALAAESARRDRPLVRVAAWQPTTLSLGAFQRLADALARPEVAGFPVVRRPSGGGAILHGSDLTVAVAVPRGHPLAATPRSLYDAVHESLVEELVARGVAARLSPGASSPDAPEADATPEGRFFCFDRRSEGDVVVDGPGADGSDRKILGSAQRRLEGAVLQHGSLLLDANPDAGDGARHPGLRELGGGGMELAGDPVAGVVGAWLGRFARRLGLTPEWVRERFVPADPRAHRDRVERFRDPSWTGRR